MTRFIGTLLLSFSFSYTFGQTNIQYIANEGILIQIDENKILIDAIFDDHYEQFSAPSKEFIENLNTKSTPYQNIDLLLVTHAHLDHFNSKMIASFMEAHEETEMVCTNQAKDSLSADQNSLGTYQDRIIGMSSNKEWQSHSKKDIQIKTTYVRHGGQQNYNIDNHIYLIQSNEKSILHIGDAEMDINHFNHLDLEESKIDVALVPFWFLAYPPGVNIINTKIKPKKIIGIHYPKVGDPKTLEMIKNNFPKATVFTKQGEQVSF